MSAFKKYVFSFDEYLPLTGLRGGSTLAIGLSVCVENNHISSGYYDWIGPL